MPGSASDSRTRATLPGCFIGSWESLPRGFKRTSVTPKPAIRSVACLAIKRAWRVEWCRLRDSNPRPPDYKSGALPTELSRPGSIHIYICRYDRGRILIFPHVQCEGLVAKNGSKVRQRRDLTRAQLPIRARLSRKECDRVDFFGAVQLADENRFLAAQQAHRSRLEEGDRLDGSGLRSDVIEQFASGARVRSIAAAIAIQIHPIDIGSDRADEKQRD